ncbi:MAG TPA: hypothetical protein VK162_11265 [Streptosporangiaceae bacterium]|nr:hypothetical protein [Streptosporangiaceae bacterium]
MRTRFRLSLSLLAPAGSRRSQWCLCEEGSAEEITEEATGLVPRAAALEIGKASLVACLRVPHEASPGKRR